MTQTLVSAYAKTERLCICKLPGHHLRFESSSWAFKRVTLGTRRQDKEEGQLNDLDCNSLHVPKTHFVQNEMLSPQKVIQLNKPPPQNSDKGIYGLAGDIPEVE